MLKKNVIILTFLFILTNYCLAEEVSLESFIKKSLEVHPKTKVSLLEFKKTLAENLAYTATEDWNMFVSYSRTQGATVFGSYVSSAVSSSFNAYTTKSLSSYGTSLQIGVSQIAATNQPTVGNFALPDSNTYGLKVQITQPLLKNAFGKADQYPLKLKVYLDEIAQITYQQQIQDFITILTEEYIKWHYLENDIKILKDQVKKSKKQLKITERQQKLGAAEIIDIITSKQNVLLRENTLLSKEFELTNQRKKIYFYMTGNVSESNHQITSLVDENVLNKTLLKDSRSSLLFLEEISLFKQLFDINEKIASLTLEYESENMKPNLDIYLSADLDNYKTYLENQANSDDNYTLKGDAYPFTLGFSFSKPLKNIVQNSAQESAKENLFKTINNNKLNLNNVKESVIMMYEQLTFLTNQKIIVKESIRLSSKAANLEYKKFDQGRSNSLQFYHEYKNQQLSYELQLNQIKYLEQSLINQLFNMNDYYITSYNLEDIK